jgi:hypothetical protein
VDRCIRNEPAVVEFLVPPKEENVLSVREELAHAGGERNGLLGYGHQQGFSPAGPVGRRVGDAEVRLVYKHVPFRAQVRDGSAALKIVGKQHAGGVPDALVAGVPGGYSNATLRQWVALFGKCVGPGPKQRECDKNSHGGPHFVSHGPQPNARDRRRGRT